MKNALVIFTRNPELGKCKTRLAKVIGDKSALEIYKYLLQHTANVSKEVDADRFVFYSESIQDALSKIDPFNFSLSQFMTLSTEAGGSGAALSGVFGQLRDGIIGMTRAAISFISPAFEFSIITFSVEGPIHFNGPTLL